MNVVTQGLLESRARCAARKAGYTAVKSRWRKNSIVNHGDFMLIDPTTGIPAAGFHYDLSAEEVIEFCADC